MKFCNEENIKKIESFLEENKENIINELMALVKIPSVQGEALEGMPFGKECHRILDTATKLYEENGFKAVAKHNDGYGYATYGYGETTIGIFAHGDVVPVDDSWIYTKPFEPIVSGRYIIGRGCNDNKSGIISALYAAKAIRDLGFPLKSRLMMITGINEETGMLDIENFAKNEKTPELTLVPDANYPLVKGEKGIFHFNITAKKPFNQIKKFKGGSAYNVVLDKVEIELVFSDALLNELKENNIDVTSDNETIFVVFTGLSSHAAHPEHSVNAGFKAVNALKDIKALCENDRQILNELYMALEGYDGKYFGLESEDEYFGKLTCANGIVDLRDGKAFVTFDVRYGCVYTNEEIRNFVMKQTDKWDIAVANDSKGYNHNGSPLADAMLDAYKYLSGDKNASVEYISGGTYSRHLKNAFSIGNYAPYKAVKPDFPEGHGSYHQPDETIDIEALIESIKIIILFILECDAIL